MIDLSTQVVKACIFREGAEVTRAGKVELAQGVQTLRVFGMPEWTDADSARIYAQEGVTCSDLRTVPLYKEGEEPKEVTETKDRIAVLKKRIEAKQLQAGLWKTNGDFSNRTKQSADEVRNYIEKLAERLESLDAEIRAAEKEIGELRIKLRRMKTNGTVLEVLVNAGAAGEYRFELKYFEQRALWRSLYELRADGTGPLEMRLRADIRQYTGEDWKDTEISLFTGNPSAAGTLPGMRPLLLDFEKPAPRFKGKACGPMSDSASMSMQCFEKIDSGPLCRDEDEDFDDGSDCEAETPMTRMQTALAEVDPDETTTEYVLPGKRNVLNDDDGNLADVQTFSIAAKYRIATVPGLDPNVYLVAAVDPVDLPVEGEINPAVYYKDVYAGKVWLDPYSADDEVEITLAREEGVRAYRKETKRRNSTTLLKGLAVTEYEYETRLVNYSESDVAVTLKDQVPVSQNKEITVEVTELSGAVLDEATGILRKEIGLPAGGTAVVRLGYKVSRPRDKTIQERRGVL